MATKIDCIWVLLFTKQKKCSERIIAQVNFTWIFKFTKKKPTVGRGLSFFFALGLGFEMESEKRPALGGGNNTVAHAWVHTHF